MIDSINIAPSTFDWHSILFCKTNTKDAFLEIKTDGTVIWKGRVVESDADFRAAMMEVHQHMCGSVNGELAKARAALAEIDRLRAELAQRTAERDEARRKNEAIEAMGYEWRWTKSIDADGEQVGAWVMRDADEADANNKAWRTSDGE